MDQYSYLGNGDISSILAIYEQYQESPETVDASWQNFFKGFDFAKANYAEGQPSANGSPAAAAKVAAPSGKAKTQTMHVSDIELLNKEFRVLSMIDAYRRRGHLFTQTNPVRKRRPYFPTLAPSSFGLDDSTLDEVFQAGAEVGLGPAKLRDILELLEQTYCRSIGSEFIYIRKPEIVRWFQGTLESSRSNPKFSDKQKKDIFFHLKQAVGFERFIHRKFVGQKRFSLEGAESLIPALDAVIERGADLGIQEFIIGMPHRGRLNVLANILRKPYEKIFHEFMGQAYDDDIELGDVKYHLGYCEDITTDNGKVVRLNVTPNPSHLETVAPVAQGITRAKIYNKYADDFSKMAPIIIHGDAAVAAQGVVYEVAQMANLKGYRTGGSIHIVINNQVGFTTDYLDARSSTYCTDIAKVTRSPVFHVNGDDVEALVYTIELAIEYRQRFKRDVWIDLLCYRKFGHNEGDEPRFTQPTLYKAIAKHPNVMELYGKRLVEEGIYTQEAMTQAQEDFNYILDLKYEKAQQIKKVKIHPFLEEDWVDYRYCTPDDFHLSLPTGVAHERLLQIAEKITHIPEGIKIFSKLVKLMEDRRAMVKEDRLDWAMGELLAYGTLVAEGHPVRMSGQDCERGTFSHRHAALVIEDSPEKYFPLKNVSPDQASFHIYNSLLSEYGVMGFEYGFALARPNGLTLWEAQFGDFHNVAQPIIDQYISSAEEKWGLKNGLVLLLPHGYEGQGPEHSSARVERFLQLCASQNMQIVNCTTPANFFHALRRQVKRDFRIPMVVFTPKSLLRHPQCVSKLSELGEGTRFQEVIDDTNVEVENVKRVVYCTGKIYYDLLAKKDYFEARDIALVRVEQLYPFPERQIEAIHEKYENSLLSLWVQEEPENMGPWWFVQQQFRRLRIDVVPVTRAASGSPATGMYTIHVARQEEILNKVFRKCTCELAYKYCGLQCVEGNSRNQILSQHRYLFE